MLVFETKFVNIGIISSIRCVFVSIFCEEVAYKSHAHNCRDTHRLKLKDSV